MRLEGKFGGSALLVVSDGSLTWTYNASTKTYTKAPTLNAASADAFGRLKFSRDPAAISNARIEREESIDFQGKPAPCYVVRANYTSMPANSYARDVARTVWIAKTTELILRDTWEFSIVRPGSDVAGKSRVTTEYTRIESGLPLADDLFVFQPPEGSRLAGSVPGNPAPGSLSTGTALAGGAVVDSQIPPQYSAEARAAKLQGTVNLYVEVKADGNPSKVQVMQGLGLGLDEKAVEAVKQWQFQPSHSQREGLQAISEIEVQFRLDPPADWNVAREVYWFNLPLHQYVGERLKPVPTSFTAPASSACPGAASVVVEMVIGQDGGPSDVRATRGDQGPVATAAVEAVRSWRFQPALEEGNPIEAHGEVELVCSAGGTPAKTIVSPSSIYRVGSLVSAPVLNFKVEPEYSEEARLAKLQGSVQLYIQISPAGIPTGIRMVRMLGAGLDKKAMEAVKRWRFTPGMKDGKPVTIEATVEVTFRLL